MKWVLFRLQAEKNNMRKNRNWPLERRRARERES